MPIVNEFLRFLNHTPSPHHAVQETRTLLKAAGFTEISEHDRWTAEPGARHFVVRSGKTIAAWIVGQGDFAENGLAIIGAHTDSPCLKPRHTKLSIHRDMSVLNVGIYGSPILQSWLDRDLTLSGALYLKGETAPYLFNDTATLRTSGLAIHLDKIHH